MAMLSSIKSRNTILIFFFLIPAEVGLLTRNIVFRGSNDQQWHDQIEACPGMTKLKPVRMVLIPGNLRLKPAFRQVFYLGDKIYLNFKRTISFFMLVIDEKLNDISKYLNVAKEILHCCIGLELLLIFVSLIELKLTEPIKETKDRMHQQRLS